jgi:hypothetical protein
LLTTPKKAKSILFAVKGNALKAEGGERGYSGCGGVDAVISVLDGKEPA